jgi:SHS2 domain-containing protein
VANSPEQIIFETVQAFSRLVERDAGGEPTLREITVEATNRAELLVELLGELIYLADTEGFVTDSIVVTLEDLSLHVSLAGRCTAVAPLVKAATYHDLSFEQRGDIWHARVVLDV